jgi:hypothetical protein
VASGGQFTRQQSPKDRVEVVVKPSNLHTVLGRQKATGDIPEDKAAVKKQELNERLKGLAKASPKFREIDPGQLGDPDEQSRVIAENTQRDNKPGRRGKTN